MAAQKGGHRRSIALLEPGGGEPGRHCGGNGRFLRVRGRFRRGRLLSLVAHAAPA